MFKKSSKVVMMSCFSFSAAMYFGTANASNDCKNCASFGHAISNNSAEKIIEVTASTKWINVTNGDTVKFVSEGKTFIWNFDTLPEQTNFKLSKIAPKDFPASDIGVYVDPNPLNRG